MNTVKKKVAVALSGGVDSSVSAALLLEQGYEVIGVTMVTSYTERILEDAERVAAGLGIKHYIADVTQKFEEIIINSFINSYLEGKTPNPCVVCNPNIKWKELLAVSFAQDAGYFATGHYALIEKDEYSGRYKLKNNDSSKDQTYFLYGLSQEQLSKTLFPLGRLTKNETRELARKFGIVVSDKPDSQEICFIPEDYRDFLKEKAMDKMPGNGNYIYKGEIKGKHNGFPFYTIGQRKGLGIALGQPVFVTGIDPVNNIVTLGEKDELLKNVVSAKNVNYVSTEMLYKDDIIFAKIRYNNPATEAVVVSADNSNIKLSFTEPKSAVAVGQSLVITDKDGFLLAGGEITTSEPF